jgi:hypothetical protein
MAGAAQPGAAHCIVPAVHKYIHRAGAGSCVKPAGKQLSAQATSCHMSGGWFSALISPVERPKTYDQRNTVTSGVGVEAMAMLAQEPSLKTHTHWWFPVATPLPFSNPHITTICIQLTKNAFVRL